MTGLRMKGSERFIDGRTAQRNTETSERGDAEKDYARKH